MSPLLAKSGDGRDKRRSILRANEQFKAVNGRIDGLEKQLSSLRNKMSARFDALESKVTLVEDVTTLKIEMKTLVEKVAAITAR